MNSTSTEKNEEIRIVFLFFEGMTALDVVGPHEVLGRLPGAVVQRVAEHAGPIRTESNDLILTAEHGLSEVSSADVLVIPGGPGATSLRDNLNILDWVRKIHTTTIWTTSVCTGSLILGAAGLLSGVPATCHWIKLDQLSHWGAHPTQKRVVESGKIMTSAGIDMALLLAAKIKGQAVAETIQLGIEYDPEPPFDAGSVDKADPEIVKALRTRVLLRASEKTA